MRLFLKSLGLLIIITSCYFNNKNDNYKNTHQVDKQYIKSYILDNLLKQYEPYSLCGNYFHDFSNETLKSFFESFPDSIISDNDLDILVNQYNTWKGKPILKLVDTNNFKKIENLDNYSNYEFSKKHFAISPFLLSQNKTICVVYVHAFIEEAGQSGIFIVFNQKEGSWHYLAKVFIKIPQYEDGYHFHDFSLVNKKFLNSN